MRQVFPDLSRAEINAKFVAFDEDFIEGNAGIKTDDQVFGLVRWLMQH
ncbi:MAG TPA: hypothetical protein VH599_18390 [Ktedonobacterales bacterium]